MTALARLVAMLLAISGAACAASASDVPDPAKPTATHGPAQRAATAVPTVVLPPDKLAVLAGPLYAPAAGQARIAFYGTDLGVSFQHHDELRILFGDTWSDAAGTLIGTESDDAQGVISTQPPPAGFPSGDAVDAFVASQRLAAGEPWWKRAAPPVTMHVTNGQAAPFELYRGGFHGQAVVNMSIGRAVVAAFSNARDGAFAILRRDVPVACSASGAARCEDGFECDSGLGVCSNSASEYPTTCVLGSDRCGSGAACVANDGAGFCQDRTSSLYSKDDEFGRLESVVIEQEIGNADPDQPARYFTQPWATNKFTNPIAKTVADFDPTRADPDDNDYRPADGSQPEREKVLLWGRPHTCGTGATGRESRLYFAYADMPEYSDSGAFAWHPRYLSGFEHGRPTFSERQSDAIALDLGGEPTPESEPFDIVDRTAVTYLPTLQRWLMFYGGDFAPPVLSVFEGANYERVVRDPNGAIHARFATHPWGPWSLPAAALQAGDASASPPAAGSEYASLGMLHHDGCAGANCIPGEQSISHVLTPYGFLYAPNIFDTWTSAREHGEAVDVYWNVSTWNPYQTVLLRTRIRR